MPRVSSTGRQEDGAVEGAGLGFAAGAADEVDDSDFPEVDAEELEVDESDFEDSDFEDSDFEDSEEPEPDRESVR